MEADAAFAVAGAEPSPHFVVNLIANFARNPTDRIDKVHDKVRDKGN